MLGFPDRAEAGHGGGLAGSGSDTNRLRQLRDRLPCEVTVSSALHPLYQRQLVAVSFAHRDGELMLSVELPDGSPALVPAALTDVFGTEDEAPAAATILSVEGVRRLRGLVAIGLSKADGAPGRPRPWKVVRRAHGGDAFASSALLFSAHAGKDSAVRSRDRERAKVVRAEGHAAAGGWVWEVVYDPAGLVNADSRGVIKGIAP